jgi:hypothetical protein
MEEPTQKEKKSIGRMASGQFIVFLNIIHGLRLN